MSQFSREHYRDLLAELRSGIGERLRAEEELAESNLSEGEFIPGSPQAALRTLTAEYQTNLTGADERYSAERQSIDDRFQASLAGATGNYQRTIDQIERQCTADQAAAEKKFNEDCWLLSSILDDKSESSPKWQLERLRSQIEQTGQRLTTESREVEALYEQAVGLAEHRRQRAGEIPAPAAAPEGREATAQAGAAAAKAVREQFDKLSRQMVPRMLAGWSFVLVAVLLWGALFGVGYVFISPEWLGLTRISPSDWMLICGGVAFATAGLLMLVIYAIAAQQTAQVLGPLLQGVADARFCQQQWQKFARTDLSRSEHEFNSRHGGIVERREKSLEQFTATRDQRLRDLDKRRDEAVQAAANERDAALQAASERHGQELLAAEAAHRSETTALRTKYERDGGVLTRNQQQASAERLSRRQELALRSESVWNETTAWFAGETRSLEEDDRRQFPSWDDLARPDWPPAESIPEGIRIGEYRVEPRQIAGPAAADDQKIANEAGWLLPAVLPFPASPALVIQAAGEGKRQAIDVLQAAVLRLLVQLPPGDVRLTIIDPVGLGENFAAFMHLADYDDLLISSRIWTEASHIEQQLANLTEHMENVFQKYLRNEFESIEDYNQHAGEVAEPYRILVVANFPAGFSERAAQRLVSVVASGPRCGVHTLISLDSRQPLPRGFDIEVATAAATVLEWEGKGFINRRIDKEPLPFVADAPPPAPVLAALIKRVGELSKHVRRVEVPFYRIVPREEAYWTGDSRSQIEVPLGRAGATKLQHLRLGPGTSQHVLVAGKTGSGKSTLLHVIVTNLALRYSPDEVEFYLIDFKKGVEFKTYAARHLPHARVISIESDREFGVSVLERLDAILKERGDLFRKQGVQDIAAYRNVCPGERMPRIVFMVDEFQEFFVEDDRYSQTAALLLDRLVRQGRAFGIHVLLGSQTLGGAYSLARTTIGQMAVRIALQCSEADAHLILSEDNTAARLLTRPGEALYNDANGLVEGNNLFQIAWLDDDERDTYLDRIEALAVERGARPSPPIVFEGNLPADPGRNAELCELLAPAPADRAATLPQLDTPRAWLGDAVAITGPTVVTFSRRSGSNLLVVGQDAEAALGMFGNALLALATQVRDPAVDGGPMLAPFQLLAGGSESEARERWRTFVGLIGDRVAVAGPEGAAGVVTTIAAEVARRRQDRTPAAPVFLVIDDLSRFRDLRKSDDDFGSFGREKTVTPGQALAEVLREGPAVGVHIVIWCDSYNNVDRWFSRQTLREFDLRVVFQMSAADSSNLIDSPAAARLGPNRAILYSDERGTAEKFRPYGPPSVEWLNWLSRHVTPTGGAEPAVADDIDQWLVT